MTVKELIKQLQKYNIGKDKEVWCRIESDELGNDTLMEVNEVYYDDSEKVIVLDW